MNVYSVDNYFLDALLNGIWIPFPFLILNILILYIRRLSAEGADNIDRSKKASSIVNLILPEVIRKETFTSQLIFLFFFKKKKDWVISFRYTTRNWIEDNWSNKAINQYKP